MFKPGCAIVPFVHIFMFWRRKNKFLRHAGAQLTTILAATALWLGAFTCGSLLIGTEIILQEDHDGPVSLTWANSFAYLLLKFQPSSLL